MEAVRTRMSGPVVGCADAFALADFSAVLLGWNVIDRWTAGLVAAEVLRSGREADAA